MKLNGDYFLSAGMFFFLDPELKFPLHVLIDCINQFSILLVKLKKVAMML
jgi:hypothetical protein